MQGYAAVEVRASRRGPPLRLYVVILRAAKNLSCLCSLVLEKGPRAFKSTAKQNERQDELSEWYHPRAPRSIGRNTDAKGWPMRPKDLPAIDPKMRVFRGPGG